MSTIIAPNPYLPRIATIKEITVENEARDIKTFQIVLDEDHGGFDFSCGQFAMLSVQGVGESPIGIASSPLDRDFLEFTVKRYPTGLLTSALHDLEDGDSLRVRGPYGRPYPMEEMEGKNVVIVGGGFAVTTLRSTIKYLLDKSNRSRYGDITVIYGARNPGELIYKQELKRWEEMDGLAMHITVDRGDENWKGREGFVPAVLKEVAPSSENAFVLVCGPPIMLKFTMVPLRELGFGPDRIITSLERRMSCGVGKCGRCNVGQKYVCKDGPVFTYQEVQELAEGIF